MALYYIIFQNYFIYLTSICFLYKITNMRTSRDVVASQMIVNYYYIDVLIISYYGIEFFIHLLGTICYTLLKIELNLSRKQCT